MEKLMVGAVFIHHSKSNCKTKNAVSMNLINYNEKINKIVDEEKLIKKILKRHQ
jgi:hypothetical protein